MASRLHSGAQENEKVTYESSRALHAALTATNRVDGNSQGLSSVNGTDPSGNDESCRRPVSWWRVFREAAADWSDDRAPRLGAALAYYTVFSLAPTLVIAIAIAGFAFGSDAVHSQLDDQLQGFVGKEGAEGIESMIAAANKPKSGMIASLFGIAALLFGASGVFVAMKDALNTIFEVEPKPGIGFWTKIKDRFLSFAMVFAIGFMLMVTLLVSAAVAALTRFLGNAIPGPDVLAHGLDLLISVGVVTLLFALIFKYLPDIKIAWRDVWLGATVTAILFTIGKYAIGMYLGMAAVGSAYGAAGSLILILVWAYYSSQILFFGAELTQAYSRLCGSKILPSDKAQAVTAETQVRRHR